jgi:hypothetical protein
MESGMTDKNRPFGFDPESLGGNPFDKGYVDYRQYNQWSLEDIYFVTRQKDNAVYDSIKEFDILDEIDDAVLKDETINLTIRMEKSLSLEELPIGMILTIRYMNLLPTTLSCLLIK